MSDYPEHDKQAEVMADASIIGEFLDWLIYDKGVVFAGYDSHDDLRPKSFSIEDLLADYCEIDLVIIEAEKRKMIEELQDENIRPDIIGRPMQRPCTESTPDCVEYGCECLDRAVPEV